MFWTSRHVHKHTLLEPSVTSAEMISSELCHDCVVFFVGRTRTIKMWVSVYTKTFRTTFISFICSTLFSITLWRLDCPFCCYFSSSIAFHVGIFVQFLLQNKRGLMSRPCLPAICDHVDSCRGAERYAGSLMKYSISSSSNLNKKNQCVIRGWIKGPSNLCHVNHLFQSVWRNLFFFVDVILD